jgi:hypothetical protein
MASNSPRFPFRSGYERIRTVLRRHSQAAVLLIGLVVAVGGAILWHRNIFGPIRGSLMIGIGSSAIAGAIVAYFSPFSEAAFRRFISLGIDKVWSSRDAVLEREWVDWVYQAKNTCTLMGVAHGKWCEDERFIPALRDRLENGVWVKILFLDPNSSAAERRALEEARRKKGRNTQDAIRSSIKYLWDFRQTLEAGVRERLRLYVYDATPSCGLTWMDDHMIVTHYLAGLPDLTSPAVDLKPAQIGTGGLFDVYARNVEKIENGMSTELDERNIAQFLPKTGEEAVGDPGTSSTKIEEGRRDADVHRSL